METTNKSNSTTGSGLPAASCSADPRVPSRERGCTGKTNLGRSYKKQADKLSGKHGKKYGVYSCSYCGGTHLTTKINKACMYDELLHISEPNVKGHPSHTKNDND